MIQLKEKTRTVVVICAFGQYNAPGPLAKNRTQLPDLKEIGRTVLRLQELFSSERYQAEDIEVIPPLQCESSEELRARLTEVRQAVHEREGTNLVLFWSGHGGLDAGSFRLATPDTYAPIKQEDGLGLDEISRTLGIARVRTWTLFLDACHAGSGFLDTVTSVSRQVMAESSELRGFGSVHSSEPYDRARDSVFLNAVINVLMNGPSSAAVAFGQSQGRAGSFNPFDRLLSASQIFEAVDAEYQADPAGVRNARLPMPVFGGVFNIFPNPQFQRDQTSRLVEESYRTLARPSDLDTHFFPKAIGIDNLETGWHFSGRVGATRAILEWIGRRSSNTLANSLYVLAADGGTGKSALLGRLIALTDKGYREKATEQGWDEATDRILGTVPNVDGIDAALNLRNLTAQTVADHLADILKLSRTDSVEDFVTTARKAYLKVGISTPCIVLDALDEAEDPSAIVQQVIHPLAKEGWKVIVATRPSVQARGANNLLAILGEATTYRLDHDLQSAEDIYRYAYGRLKQSEALLAVAELWWSSFFGHINRSLFCRFTLKSVG